MGLPIQNSGAVSDNICSSIVIETTQVYHAAESFLQHFTLLDLGWEQEPQERGVSPVTCNSRSQKLWVPRVQD